MDLQLKTVIAASVALLLSAVTMIIILKKSDIIKIIAFSLCYALMTYIVSSAVLLSFDAFTINRTLAVETGFQIIALIVIWIKHKRMVIVEIDWDIKSRIPLIIILLFGIVLSFQKFGYFGMIQDQGVYQNKAILFERNITEREFCFDEYDKLNSDAEKSLFQKSWAGLSGFDSKVASEYSIWNDMFYSGDYSFKNEASGFFHGIPTFPALLALWARLFGIENMAGVQTIIYLLSICVLWFVLERLKIKKPAMIFAVSMFTLSPEVVWVSKSTFTEPMLGLILACFLYQLSNPEYSKRWLSCSMVLMFSIWHVSIFVMIWMFIVVYWIMYFVSAERQYIKAAIISAVVFILGYTMMVYLAPRYSIRNTQVIWAGPINVYNVYYILIGLACMSIIISVVFAFLHASKKKKTLENSNIWKWIFRIALIAMTVVIAWNIYKRSADEGDLVSAIQRNGVWNMMWMTGLLILPVTIVYTFIKPQIFLKNELTFGLAFVFFYAVILMTCIFKADIQYCYYYGRYLAPYVVVAVAVGSYVWNCLKAKTIIISTVISSCMLLPFDYVLCREQDVTNMPYSVLSSYLDSLPMSDKCAIIMDEPTARVLCFPTKARMSNMDIYYCDETKLYEQISSLDKKYNKVLYAVLSDTDMRWEKEREHLKVQYRTNYYDENDDNISNRLTLIPFPLAFFKTRQTFSLYTNSEELELINNSATRVGEQVRDGVLSTGDEGFVLLGQYFRLPKGEYTIHVDGEIISGMPNESSWWDIAANKGEKVLYNERGLNRYAADSKLSIMKDITVDQDYEDAEIRLYVNKDIKMLITSVRIERKQ